MLRNGCWLHAVLSDSTQYQAACNLTLRSIILSGVNLKKNWITWQNRNQNRKYFKPLLSGPGSLELWRKKIVVLSFKKDTEKSHGSAQYDSVRNLTPRSIILGGTSEKLEYLGENETEKEITHWSEAQAGLNDEKNWG